MGKTTKKNITKGISKAAKSLIDKTSTYKDDWSKYFDYGDDEWEWDYTSGYHGGGYGGWFNTCEHVHTKVEIGDNHVFTIGSRSIPKDGYMPMDVSIYLDVLSWKRIRGEAKVLDYDFNAKLPRIYDEYGEIIYIHWPDYGIINLDRLRRLVGVVRSNWTAKRTIEIGCVGAHGRTGTLLAALLIRVEKMKAADAIKEIRKRYCDNAIETISQERLLHEFNNEKFVAPKTVPYTSTKYTRNYSKPKKEYTGYWAEHPQLGHFYEINADLPEVHDSITPRIIDDDVERWERWKEDNGIVETSQTPTVASYPSKSIDPLIDADSDDVDILDPYDVDDMTIDETLKHLFTDDETRETYLGGYDEVLAFLEENDLEEKDIPFLEASNIPILSAKVPDPEDEENLPF